jgi:spore maturation protein CgeB
MKIFAFGSSILSSYWNGAATYYRGIYKYLARRGHSITFAEPDAYGRQQHRDSGDYSYVHSVVYQPQADVDRMLAMAADADIVIKHSGIGVDDALLEGLVPELRDRSAVFFWDVDAPATVGRLWDNPADPFYRDIRRYDGILTYGGGPASRDAYLQFGARSYESVYNAFDPETHHPVPMDPEYSCDIAFVGNRLPDREQRVTELFLGAAELAPDRRLLLGGEGWGDKSLPSNVRWIGHVGTCDHNRINCSAAMVLNINRSSMASFGFSPPTRIFEAAGAGACLLCDAWPGLEECFTPSRELIVIQTAADIVRAMYETEETSRRRMGTAFRERALRDHTYAQRACQAEAVFSRVLRERDRLSLLGSVTPIEEIA